MNMLPQVVKRDGTVEKFSVINIAKVALAAGLSPKESQQLSESLATWASGLQQPQISSLVIRDKMLEEMRKINEQAAEMYQWYEQSKEL